MASNSKLSETEIQKLSEELGAAEAKLSLMKKPASARIFRALICIISALTVGGNITNGVQGKANFTNCIYPLKEKARCTFSEAAKNYWENKYTVMICYAIYLASLGTVEWIEYRHRNYNMNKIAKIKKLVETHPNPKLTN